ncbi:MAG: ComF family protein [Bacteroidetes bacterium]|nr:ComF family protein [Bacteroidota bacterium]
MSWLSDFITLIYPRVCMACGESLLKHEECICSQCIYYLPKTNFHKEKENEVSKLFWGRVEIQSACAFYYFKKQSKVQNLLHQLKYKGQKQVGVKLGSLYGVELKQDKKFEDINLIIPVPLHPDKEKKRGYNQSEMFAIGLSQTMQAPAESSLLIRNFASETQTKKSKYNRWENVKSIFEVTDSEKLKGKHILLVDDVITTGATIEACAQHLLSVPGTRVSIAAIACSIN